jgi:hypothetical protein
MHLGSRSARAYATVDLPDAILPVMRMMRDILQNRMARCVVKAGNEDSRRFRNRSGL